MTILSVRKSFSEKYLTLQQTCRMHIPTPQGSTGTPGERGRRTCGSFGKCRHTLQGTAEAVPIQLRFHTRENKWEEYPGNRGRGAMPALLNCGACGHGFNAA
jgi:hypothetical protein